MVNMVGLVKYATPIAVVPLQIGIKTHTRTKGKEQLRHISYYDDE
jgi:hypothetical protein